MPRDQMKLLLKRRKMLACKDSESDSESTCSEDSSESLQSVSLAHGSTPSDLLSTRYLSGKPSPQPIEKPFVELPPPTSTEFKTRLDASIAKAGAKTKEILNKRRRSQFVDVPKPNIKTIDYQPKISAAAIEYVKKLSWVPREKNIDTQYE